MAVDVESQHPDGQEQTVVGLPEPRPVEPTVVVVPREREGDALLVRFGRSRFLKVLGGGLVAVATGLVARSEPAEASHIGPDYPCAGFQKCHYCDGRICYRYCHWHDNHTHCESGGQCWNKCKPGTNQYIRCCDWHQVFPGHAQTHCICAQYWSVCP